MLAFLSAPTYDPLASIKIDVLPDVELPERRRRTNRVATLDGGAVSNDFGYADADLTIELRWKPTEAVDAAVDRMVRLYGSITVATRDGVFSAVPDLFAPGSDQSSLRLLVLERLSDI
jgi:hypothetical protein